MPRLPPAVRFRRSASSWSSSSATAASAAHTSMWFHRGEREMRHAEAGCLLAPVLLLPILLGSSVPLPVHIAVVFAHAFVVVPFAAGIYPPGALHSAKEGMRCKRTFVSYINVSSKTIIFGTELQGTNW